MHSVVDVACLRRWARPALVVAFAAGTAACSSDTARFSNPFASHNAAPAPETTGSIAAAPVQRVEQRPLNAAPRPVAGGREIIVAGGETMESIALRYRSSVPDIMQANGLPRGAMLHEGQRLIIPHRSALGQQPMPLTPKAAAARIAGPAPAATVPRNSGVHVVAPGETLMSIAHRYHKSVRELVDANRMGFDAHLKIGDRIIIPGISASNATAPAPEPVASSKPAPAAKQQIAMAEPPQTARMATPVPQAAKDAVGESTGSTPSFRWPVRGRIISGFGPIPNGQQNDGINLSVPEGTAVRAAEDGVVAYAGNELKGYGNLVLVRHGNGFVTAYAHASELMVKRGDQVRRGQVIAKSGQTGTVSAPQLHFEIRNGSAPVDPMKFLPPA